MQTPTRTAALLATSALALLTAGCGGAADKVSEQVAEKAVEQAIENEGGGNVDIDTDGDGSLSIETEDGSFSTGTGELPETWPEDVPLPEGLEIGAGTTMDSSDGKLVSITAASDASPAELLEELKETLSAWTISGEVSSTSTTGDLASAQWDTEGRRLTFVATSSPDGTALTIGHTTIE